MKKLLELEEPALSDGVMAQAPGYKVRRKGVIRLLGIQYVFLLEQCVVFLILLKMRKILFLQELGFVDNEKKMSETFQ